MTWRIDLPGAGKIFWREIAIRLVIITVFIITENLDPFHRVIQPEEVWLYRYPSTPSYITSEVLYVYIVCSCLSVIGFFCILNRNFRDAWEALLVASLAIPMNGLITNSIKLSVGRPRPDYFDRCYPGQSTFDITQPCTGDPDKIEEGRKSFPSGHSSNIFSSMVFIALYFAGKLGTFNSRGRGQSWRLVVTLFPLIIALLVAISRTADYHHHWQDVTIGSILGIITSFVVYRQHYPPLTSEFSDLPFILLQNLETDSFGAYRPVSQSSNLTAVKTV